jgi:hypothetical protein
MTTATTKTERMRCVEYYGLMTRDSYRLHDAHSLFMVDLFGIISPIAVFLSCPFTRRYTP